MPLIKSKSKKAFEKNVETEMKANPDPKDRAQNLAIAYSVKRKAAHKMAQGGAINKSQNPHARKHGISEMGEEVRLKDTPGMENAHRSHAKEIAENTLEAIKKQTKPKLALGGAVPSPGPKMAESRIINPQRLDSYGRRIEEENHAIQSMPPHKYEGMSESMGPAEEEYMDDEMRPQYADGGAISNLVSGIKQMINDPKPYNTKIYKAEGGEIEDEHHDSIASAIMARRAHMENGRYEHPDDAMLKEGEVDIDDNGKEMPNAYYHQNEEEALEENLDADLEDISQPRGSNEHGDSREDVTSDKNSRVSAIRNRMISKRISR